MVVLRPHRAMYVGITGDAKQTQSVKLCSWHIVHPASTAMTKTPASPKRTPAVETGVFFQGQRQFGEISRPHPTWKWVSPPLCTVLYFDERIFHLTEW